MDTPPLDQQAQPTSPEGSVSERSESERPVTERSVSERARAFSRQPRVSAAILAILIGYASILSAVVAWRASLASIDASRYESLHVQQQARRQQIERDLEGLIAQDLRVVNVFQEHSLAARELRSQADELRSSDADAADVLDLEAQSRLDLARSIQPFFLGATGATLGDDGTVAYDVAFVLRNLADGQQELRELRTAQTEQLGARADARSVSLVGVAAAIVAALFFLTIAQVSRTRERIKQIFLVAGGLLVVIGTFSFVVVEILA